MKKIRKNFFCTLVSCCFFLSLFSQDKTDKPLPKEFSIPASPVFDLMGVTPSQVTNMSDIKDFKVDWSFKSWRLNPNLALQAQPVWEIFYNRKDLKKYRNASPFMRKLSTLDVSGGTVQDEQGNRRIGFATKINLFRNSDPLMVNVYDDIEQRYRSEELDLEVSIQTLRQVLDTSTLLIGKNEMRQQLQQLEEQFLSVGKRRQQEINERAKQYMGENWNSSYLDFAFGKIFTYNTDSAGSLKSLKLNRSTGHGIWLNGGLALGRKIFVSGLIRSSFYEEELNFTLQDNTTFETTTAIDVAKNTLFTFGANMRYGGPLFSFFAEFIYERKALKTAADALNDVFDAPDGKTIVAGTVKWDVVQPYTINVGGDWRVGRNLVLNYGVRCLLDKNFKTTTFTPIVNIACMMR